MVRCDPQRSSKTDRKFARVAQRADPVLLLDLLEKVIAAEDDRGQALGVGAATVMLLVSFFGLKNGNGTASMC
jgi:hypothetical protein